MLLGILRDRGEIRVSYLLICKIYGADLIERLINNTSSAHVDERRNGQIFSKYVFGKFH